MVQNNQKKKMVQIMFKTFNSSGIYIFDTAILPLYAQGIFCGMSVHLGSDLITFYPVFDGYIIKESIIKYNLEEMLLLNLCII